MTEEAQSEDFKIPGTIHLVDLDGYLKINKAGDDNIILHPRPSSNPNDPLRWLNTKKTIQFLLLIAWGFFQSVSTVWTGPIFDTWIDEFNCTYTQLNTASGVLFVFIAFGCVSLQPLALKFGKRPVYLACSLLEIAGNALTAKAKNINYIIAGNALIGFSSSPMFSLIEISSVDIFYQHQRAAKVSYVVFALYGGVALGPLAAGFISDGIGWNWCAYILIIIFAALFIIQLFLMEDTTFMREDTANLEEDILTQIKSHETANFEERSDNFLKADKPNNVMPDDTISIDSSIPMKSYFERMKLYLRENQDPRAWVYVCFKPFFLTCIPTIVWCGVLQGAQQMWLTFVLNTQSLFYSGPHYNFSSSIVGLTNVSTFVGIVFGMLYSGSFSDSFVIWCSKRNKGIYEPEFRLWPIWLPVVINASGLLAYGLGAYYETHWAVPVVIGQSFLGFSMASITGLAYTFCTDSYPRLADDGIVCISFINNGVATIFTFLINDWMERDGLKVMTWLLFMLSLIFNCSCIFFILLGKRMRRKTVKLYDKLLNLGEIS